MASQGAKSKTKSKSTSKSSSGNRTPHLEQIQQRGPLLEQDRRQRPGTLFEQGQRLEQVQPLLGQVQREGPPAQAR